MHAKLSIVGLTVNLLILYWLFVHTLKLKILPIIDWILYNVINNIVKKYKYHVKCTHTIYLGTIVFNCYL